MEEMMEVDNIINNNIKSMEVENDEAANELSLAIQNQNPFHYAKLYLHKEVTNRDAKINELLAQINNCHQEMDAMQSKDRLFYMIKELNQQKDAHQKTKDEMHAMNLQYHHLFAQFHQKNEQYQQLEVILKRNEKMIEEAVLKSRQCDEMWIQLSHEAERYRQLESELRRDGAMKFSNDTIIKKLVEETRCLNSRLISQKQEQRDEQYEKDLLKESSRNPFKCDDVLVNHCQIEHTSKVHNNPFKKPDLRVPKYEKELQKDLGSDVPINPFKRQLIADDEVKNEKQWNPFKVKKNVNAHVDSRNKEEKKVIEESNNYDGISEKYENLPSNVHLNPFKHPNASLNGNNSNNHNNKYPSNTWIKHPAVDSNTKIEPLSVASNSWKTWVRHSNNGKPGIKRQAEDSLWELHSNNVTSFKKRKFSENQHQQITFLRFKSKTK